MVATVTAVAPTAAGYLTVYPSLTAQPTASDLNFTPATYAVPNLVVDPLGVDGADLVFNYAGGTHVVVDVVGYFIGDTALPATTRTAAAGDITAVSGPPDGVRQVTLAPAAPVPAVGEVLAAGSPPATPDGLLGLVTATGTDGAGHPVLITEPAPLQQALGNGHFAIAGTLSADNVAKVDSALPTNQIIAGTGLGLLHAYDGATGADVPGFPKQTGGWLAAPASLSFDGRIADMTREGYLFEWQTSAPACQSEWPSFRHDQQGSGNYNHDGTPPNAPAGVTLTPLGSGHYTLAFTAPGDNGPCGTPAAYVTRVGSKLVDLGLGTPVAGGSAFTHEITLPATARKLSVQARDAAGNLGPAIAVAVP